MQGTPLLMAEKKKGIIIAVLASPVGMKDALRSVKELPFPLFPKPKQRLEDFKPGSEHVVNPMFRS